MAYLVNHRPQRIHNSVTESGYSKSRRDKLASQDRCKKRFRELRREHREELASKHVQDLVNGQRVALAGMQGQNIIEELGQSFEIAKLEPNVCCSLIGEVMKVYEGEQQVIIEAADGQAREFHALIVSYYNRLVGRTSSQPARKPGVVNDVSAAITYRFFDGTPSFAVHRGAWLSEKFDRVNFGRNDKRSLIVATYEEMNQVYAVERQFDGVHPDGITKRTRLPGNLVGVHVRLIAESEGKIVNVYDAILEIEREPTFTLKLTDSRFWKLHSLNQMTVEGYNLSLRMYGLEKENQFTDKAKNQMIEEIRDWETTAATFIGQHLSEQQKTDVLNSYPSIEQGVQGEHRLSLIPRIGSLAQPAKQEYRPPFWTLHDSIKVRADKLHALANSLVI